MKVNRRGFFAAAAAAPVAAKQAVTSVLEYEKTAAIGPNTGFGLGGTMVTPDKAIYYDQGWLHQELKDLMSRKESVVKSDYLSHEIDRVAFIQIDNRRATSPAMRALFIAEERARREKARELSYLDRQIESVKKRLGPLGVLFE